MSLLKSISKFLGRSSKSVARIATSTNPLATAAAGLMGGAKSVLPAVAGAMPGIGTAMVAADIIWDDNGTVQKKRKRSKGITPKDLKSFKRVARLIDKYAAPVHKLRKSSYKPQSH